MFNHKDRNSCKFPVFWSDFVRQSTSRKVFSHRCRFSPRQPSWRRPLCSLLSQPDQQYLVQMWWWPGATSTSTQGCCSSSLHAFLSNGEEITPLMILTWCLSDIKMTTSDLKLTRPEVDLTWCVILLVNRLSGFKFTIITVFLIWLSYFHVPSTDFPSFLPDVMSSDASR